MHQNPATWRCWTSRQCGVPAGDKRSSILVHDNGGGLVGHSCKAEAARRSNNVWRKVIRRVSKSLGEGRKQSDRWEIRRMDVGKQILRASPKLNLRLCVKEPRQLPRMAGA